MTKHAAPGKYSRNPLDARRADALGPAVRFQFPGSGDAFGSGGRESGQRPRTRCSRDEADKKSPAERAILVLVLGRKKGE